MDQRPQRTPRRSAGRTGSFPPDEIATARLRLRRPRLADAQAIFDTYSTDEEVTRYLAWRPHRSVDDTKDFLIQQETAWETGVGHRGYIIERSSDRRLLGMIGADVSARGANVGYVLGREHWGHGYMTEALVALCEAALADPFIHRVCCLCDVDNRASARVMEKAGLQYEGTLRKYMRHVNVSPGPRDCHVFARVR